MEHIQSRPFHTAEANQHCEACVFGTSEHADFCPNRNRHADGPELLLLINRLADEFERAFGGPLSRNRAVHAGPELGSIVCGGLTSGHTIMLTRREDSLRAELVDHSAWVNINVGPKDWELQADEFSKRIFVPAARVLVNTVRRRQALR